MDVTIDRIAPCDEEWVLEMFRGWGADFIVSRGRKIYSTDIDGSIARHQSGGRVGLVTYEIVGDQCEIITLDAFMQFCGIGTRLIESVISEVKSSGVARLWVITTNDNLDAIRFYQKRAFTIAAVHAGSMEQSRKLKSSIPLVGQHGIPIRDEIEFEMMLK